MSDGNWSIGPAWKDFKETIAAVENPTEPSVHSSKLLLANRASNLKKVNGPTGKLLAKF